MIGDGVRRDFPMLSKTVHGKALIYFDNAATTQLPRRVIARVVRHYRNDNGNVHRGGHWLSGESTRAYEKARDSIRLLIGADSADEIVFTSGTTAAVNSVARMIEDTVNANDEIVVTEMEHHSNYLPWLELCKRKRARLRRVPVKPDGSLDMTALRSLVTCRTRLVAATAVSNVTGIINPIAEITSVAHKAGALSLCDGAQAMRMGRVDVKALGVDFFCFSGHKLLAPTGIGALYMKKSAVSGLCPSSFGGGMISGFSGGAPVYEPVPMLFEPGTPNYAAAIGLGEAAEYLFEIGRDGVAEREKLLMERLVDGLKEIDSIRIIGDSAARHGCVSFNAEGIHPFDLASMLDTCGVAVRAGHHCAIALHSAFNLSGSLRVSPAFYNTVGEIELFFKHLKRCMDLLRNREGERLGP